VGGKKRRGENAQTDIHTAPQSEKGRAKVVFAHKFNKSAGLPFYSLIEIYKVA